MELNEDVKKFIAVAKTFTRNRSDPNEVINCLEILAGNNLECSIKDSLLFSTLHDLLSTSDLNSAILWPAITVLHHACDANRGNLDVLQTINFLPVLTRFLDLHLPDEKLLQLLTILSDLTYGVKIAWQESHLPLLIETLTKIITNNNNNNLQTPALTTLVNLCYKNVPALYVLTRKVEIRAFMKTLAAMHGDLQTRAQVCKLLIIFGELKGQMPAEDILHFVDVTFNYVTEAFKAQNLPTLKQIVAFFKDVNEEPRMHEVISRYQRTQQDAKRLIELLESFEKCDELNEDCVATLLDFFPTIFKINPQKVTKLLEPLLRTIKPWIQNRTTLIPVLNNLLMVTELEQCELLDQIFDGLPIDTLMDNQLDRESLSVVAELFTKLSSVSDLFQKRFSTSSECKSFVGGLFDDILQTNFMVDNCLSLTANKLCVQLTILTGTLAEIDDGWRESYESLLEKKEIICAVAVAILNGDKALQLRAFQLISSWDAGQLSRLSEALTETRQSFVTDLECDVMPKIEWVSISSSEQRVKDLLDAGELTAPAGMEVYEYKLSAMEQSERHLKTALETADKRCVGLNQQVLQLRGQVARLHQSLFDAQNVIDGRTAEKTDLMKQLDDLRAKMDQDKKMRNSMVKSLTTKINEYEKTVKNQREEIASNETTINEQMKKIQEISDAYDSTASECEKVKMNLADILQILEKQVAISEQLKGQVHEREKDIADCKMRIQNHLDENITLKKHLTQSTEENSSLKESLAKSMEENSQKMEKLAECERKIMHLEQIREAVISVAGKNF